MHTFKKRHAVTLGMLTLFAGLCHAPTRAADLYRAQGEMAGEVSTTSSIVQTRLTSVDRNVEGDVPGAPGAVRFEYAVNEQFERSRLTPWDSARAESDYIVKAVLRDLKPATRYYYRVLYGVDQENARTGPTCSFRTLQGATGTDAVSFVVVTGMNYSSFHGPKRTEKGPRPDRAAGSPALKKLIDMELDFFVG
ncbi:MAG: PhoD-like phosphatase N-terminal domain-containing protein, partial [Planctomycetota bacterium]